MTVLQRVDGFQLDDDPARVDRDLVWKYLAEAPWAPYRTREQLERQLDGAWRVVGAYGPAAGEQVGFARAVSDGVSFGYLCDLFVVEHARGLGLGSRMVRELVDTPPGSGFRWLLHTAHTHGLYAQYGFRPADHTVMERPAP